MSEVAGVVTVPEAGVRIGVPCDRLRKELRRRPELAALVRRVGPTRVIAVADLERLRAGIGV
jgi:hypothetical protein